MRSSVERTRWLTGLVRKREAGMDQFLQDFPIDDWVDEDVFDRNLKYCRREHSHLERKTFNLTVDICS